MVQHMGEQDGVMSAGNLALATRATPRGTSQRDTHNAWHLVGAWGFQHVLRMAGGERTWPQATQPQAL